MKCDHCIRTSLGCLECRSRTQTSLANAVEDIFEEFEEPQLLTFVFEEGVGAWPPDGGIVPRTLVRQGRDKFVSSLLRPVLLLGAIDFSLNYDEMGDRHLNAHFHGVTSRPLSSAELKRLKGKCPRNPALHIYKPVTQKPIRKGDLRSVGEYCCKSSYTKRSSFIAVPKGDRNPYRDGRDQSLSAKEDGLFTGYLSDHQVCDHIITHGLKRVRTSDPAEVRLMLTTKK